MSRDIHISVSAELSGYSEDQIVLVSNDELEGATIYTSLITENIKPLLLISFALSIRITYTKLRLNLSVTRSEENDLRLNVILACALEIPGIVVVPNL